MNINTLSVIFMRDFNKEFFDLPQNIYLNFSPVTPVKKYAYKTIRPDKKDPLCYIKHTDSDLWIYEDNGELYFSPIKRDKTSYGIYVPPTIFWLEYLDHPRFVMYKPLGIGIKKILYLHYEEQRNDNLTVNNIKLKWVENFNQATIFNYEEIDWKQLLTENIFDKINK